MSLQMLRLLLSKEQKNFEYHLIVWRPNPKKPLENGFDGKICYKLPSMLNYIFRGWALWYGWMAGFLLSFKVFLGQKM